MLHPVGGIAREFLLARFAWSIFPFLDGFLPDNVSRELFSLILSATGESYSASTEDCKSFTKQPAIRSGSGCQFIFRSTLLIGWTRIAGRHILPSPLIFVSSPSLLLIRKPNHLLYRTSGNIAS